MAQLRWILLLAGLVFLAGLAAWELRRPRQARRDALDATEFDDNGERVERGERSDWNERSEPQLGQMGDFAYDNPRVPVTPPLHVDLPSLEPAEFEPPLIVSLDEPVRPYYEQASEPQRDPEPERVFADASADADDGHIVLPAAEPMTPIVEWPPEDQRHVISVRVVGVNPDRLSGRPLRQALAACGFVHGRFGIFHQPGTDGRALISAANLSKPGVFDPTSMDFQRFRGLGLFAVLPGPLPPAAALDHLLDTAGDLAERLQARLQDETGHPLDEVRLEEMTRIVHGMSHSQLRAEPAA